jgi:hypothetical protein
MALTPVLLGFVVLLGYAAAWRAVAYRIRHPERAAAWSTPLRDGWQGLVAESGLLTLLGALWFGSLGSGGAVLLFLLLGALMELPWRLRRKERIDWRELAPELLRVALAGWLLGTVMP